MLLGCVAIKLTQMLILVVYTLTHSPFHLTDVLLHQQGINKEFPGRLGPLSKAVGKGVRVFSTIWVG